MAKIYNVIDHGSVSRTLIISSHPLDWDFETFELVANSLGNCEYDGDVLLFCEKRLNDGSLVYHVCQGPFVCRNYLKLGIHQVVFNLMSGTFQLDENPQIFHMKRR